MAFLLRSRSLDLRLLVFRRHHLPLLDCPVLGLDKTIILTIILVHAAQCVLIDAEPDLVWVLAVGIKVGSRLLVGGEEFEL